jgi:hypothetical protein
MAGTRFLFITKDLQIHKIPIPNECIYKAIPSLANQEVLEVIIHYETINRKPNKLIFVSFQRLLLNANGQYRLTNDEIDERSRNFIEFAYYTPETLSKKEGPLSIPTTLTLPTQIEKECLKDYIKKNMSKLVATGYSVIEREIASRKKINLENKKLIIEASKFRNKRKL